MTEQINTKNSYLGLVSSETYDSLMSKIVFDTEVSIKKFRQLAVIANIPPQLLFKNIGNESIAITSKFEIYENILENVDGKYFSPIGEYIPYKFIDALTKTTTKKKGGEYFNFDNIIQNIINFNYLSKFSTISFLILLLVYFYYKPHRQKIKKMVKIIKNEDTKVKDPIYEKGLKNNGDYDGCFHDISDNLHKIFQDSFIHKMSVEELRYLLINKWKSTYFGKRELLIIHLIRKDGTIRDNIEEIGHSIKDIYESGGLVSRSLMNIFRCFVPRRKSYRVKSYKTLSNKNKTRKKQTNKK